MTIRSLIVDDEQPARDELRYLLSRYNDIEVIGEADSAGKAITAIRAATPDLVFLDIQLLSSDEIIYCSYESNRILIHTRQESLPLYSITTMDRLADHLAAPPPGNARELILDLSHYMRKKLDSSRGVIPLAGELEQINSYIAIEKGRFGELIQVNIDVEPGCENWPIPSLIIQPLVKNAIKHWI